jgi:radical SAM-linked protein
VRLRYAKRGRLRFASHRDFARAFERALRRANVPIAFSAGFSPHPRVSYLGAAPTGVASEAEYLEVALAREVDPALLRAALDTALPPGLDVVEAVVAQTSGFADRIEASRWRLELPGVDPNELGKAVATFLDTPEITVSRLTKNGRREVDLRGPVVVAEVTAGAITAEEAGASLPAPGGACAILEVVVRHATPAVRPDDLLAGLHTVAGLVPPVPPRATRLAQGALTGEGRLLDPLEVDREWSVTGASQ